MYLQIKCGCRHVLVKRIDLWKYIRDEDTFAGTLLIDLWKAFDCMPHGIINCIAKVWCV